MKVKCPICKKETRWEDNPYRPFCSYRCSLIDLGKWVDEEYRIPVIEQEEKKPQKDGEKK